MTAIASLRTVAVDCADPRALADFYAAVGGYDVEPGDGDDWIQLTRDGNIALAFQRVTDFRAPAWPGQDVPQQLHLDFYTDDLDRAEDEVLAVGATKAAHQPGGESFRVYLDPQGHPFCLCRS